MKIARVASISGVIGWPVAHSLSPRLHSFWLKEYGIDGAYIPLAVKPENLPLALWALPALGFRGVNVTVPHKEQALQLVDKADSAARRVGAVNTISFNKNGQLLGSNTDAYGFMENLQVNAPEWISKKPALVIGAGGAARAVCAGLLDAGVPEVRVCNRTIARATSLANDLGGPIQTLSWRDRVEAAGGVGLLVNTTNLGMVGEPSLDMPLTKLPTGALVTDLVYAPLMTTLLTEAQARGNPVVDGLGMLLHQAAPGFAAWYGRKPVVSALLRAHVLGINNGP